MRRIERDKSFATPIKINGNQYYFRNIFEDDFYIITYFYTISVQQRVLKKRRFKFFGKVVSSETVEIERYDFAFESSCKCIDERNIYNTYTIKKDEEKYVLKMNIKNGNLNI